MPRRRYGRNRYRRKRRRVSPKVRALRKAKSWMPTATPSRIILPYMLGKYQFHLDGHFVMGGDQAMTQYGGRIMNSNVSDIIVTVNGKTDRFRGSHVIEQVYYLVGLIFIGCGALVMFMRPEILILGVIMCVLGVIAFPIIYWLRSTKLKKNKELKAKRIVAANQAVDQINVMKFYNSEFTVSVHETAGYLSIDFPQMPGVRPNHQKYPNQKGAFKPNMNINMMGSHPQTVITPMMGNAAPMPMNNFQQGMPMNNMSQQPMNNFSQGPMNPAPMNGMGINPAFQPNVGYQPQMGFPNQPVNRPAMNYQQYNNQPQQLPPQQPNMQ